MNILIVLKARFPKVGDGRHNVGGKEEPCGIRLELKILVETHIRLDIDMYTHSHVALSTDRLRSCDIPVAMGASKPHPGF